MSKAVVALGKSQYTQRLEYTKVLQYINCFFDLLHDTEGYELVVHSHHGSIIHLCEHPC